MCYEAYEQHGQNVVTGIWLPSCPTDDFADMSVSAAPRSPPNVFVRCLAL